MRFLKFFPIVSSAFLLLLASCHTSTNKSQQNKVAETQSGNTATNSSQSDTNNTANTITNTVDTAVSLQNTNPDSILAKGMSAMFGKNDSGILKKMGGGKNMDSMMQKMQSMMGGKGSNPGDALSKLILNTQMGQLKDDDPLKSVANGMQEAQENGTAGP
ncbi:MAG: hypothetical protein ABI184_03120, partial [Ginsengibacter sp.]